MTQDRPRTLFLTGTVGAGKTTVADALAETDPLPHGVIDLDALRRLSPAPPDDPFNLELELANLRAVAPNFRAAGARRLTVSGVLETATDLDRYRHALDDPALFVVRLVADPAVIAERLTARHSGDPAGLSWHLARAVELRRIQDDAQLEDALIDTSRLSVAEAVAAVRHAVDW